MYAQRRFDCVEMKNAIQARHREQYKGLTDEEVRRLIAERLASSDDVVARKWRRIVQWQHDASRGSDPTNRSS